MVCERYLTLLFRGRECVLMRGLGMLLLSVEHWRRWASWFFMHWLVIVIYLCCCECSMVEVSQLLVKQWFEKDINPDVSGEIVLEIGPFERCS